MIEVRSTWRSGRFVRQEREENDGRIQSWVLAGERGAVEMRGTGPDNLYCLIHSPVTSPGFTGGHSLLLLVDASVFPESRCTVLEAGCHPVLLGFPPPWTLELSDPWFWMQGLYDLHLEGE